MENYNYDSAYEYYYGNLTDNETYFFTDSTEVCPSSYLHGADIYLPILYSIIFLTGFIGNLFVITVVAAKGKRNGRLVDIFVVNLALADLVFVFTLPLWAVSASQSGRWNFGLIGNALCKLSSYAIAVNRFSNIFFLTCMSVDRYLAVVKLMDSRFLRSSQCIRVTCAVVWLVSLVLGIPSLVYRSVEDNGNGPICLENTQSLFFLGLSLTSVILTFVLPVLIIILCYGTIITHLQKHCAAAGNSRADARRRHSLKMVLFIIVAFIVSWLPFNIFKTIIISSQLSDAELSCYSLSWQRDGLIISCCLAFLNSCVNPAIYFFFDHHFRRHAKNLYLSCLAKPLLLQSHNSSGSFTNIGTSESSWTTVFRGRLQSFDQKG
ncbi:probable G-protein coupled receptor 25 [Myripristis murdjan]|uniref:probable G-protein coupled receptor 25 n=1 Tax=Myripristis murdjan TaxID=586833 RepID=UPI0011760C43|nr:probable G-protein coupled receptor 25 [Myripristis murdjan]